MSYINKNDLQIYLNANRLAQVSDRINGDVDDDVNIEQAIVFADGIINTYISNLGYKMPITCADGKVPAILYDLAIVFAVWKMYEGRATDEVRYRFEWAMDILKDFQKGKMGITCQNGLSAQKIVGATINNYGYAASSINDLNSYSDNQCNAFNNNECRGNW
jgi:phage gp36-like protein